MERSQQELLLAFGFRDFNQFMNAWSPICASKYTSARLHGLTFPHNIFHLFPHIHCLFLDSKHRDGRESFILMEMWYVFHVHAKTMNKVSDCQRPRRKQFLEGLIQISWDFSSHLVNLECIPPTAEVSRYPK